MQSYIFASSNALNDEALNSIEALDNICDDFFEIVLSSKAELNILLDLLGIKSVVEQELAASEDFEILYDYSETMLPELSTEDFDRFYEKWLQKTGRESDMDEYGQLTFIQGQAASWNKRTKRFVLLAKS